MKRWFLIATVVLTSVIPCLQAQNHYSGTNVTGQLILLGTVNLTQQAGAQATAAVVRSNLDLKLVRHHLKPPAAAPTGVPPLANGLAVMTTASGFAGLTHYDQRQADNGNQFSIEPPSPAVAVADGYILEGVNDAVQIYNMSGNPVLPVVLTSNQVFGLAPDINRTTGVNGVYLTDMRVFHDPDIDRWIILQWDQANDAEGNPLPQSAEWIAVSQTGDPTGTYNIYTIDTTNSQTNGCPCIPDYPQIGADRNGFYISSNEFPASSSQVGTQPVDVSVLAISKVSLSAGATTPTVYRFAIPYGLTGYEFSLQPATTPPGANYATQAGGLEYFVSSIADFSNGSNLAVWAMINTSSLATSSPNLALTQITVPTEMYYSPDVGVQQRGCGILRESVCLPYGSSLTPPGQVPYLDGGDLRVLSLSYSGGLLYATLATEVTNSTTGKRSVGGAYFILLPKYQNATLSASVLRQGYVHVAGANLLRSALAINPQGVGAIACTLVGPDFYPSAASIKINLLLTSPFVQISALGSLPEDGFTGYPPYSNGDARWGDNSAATVDSSGNIWMSVEYIPNAPRTQYANWGTYISSVQ
jgi:hypothetical protein